MCIKFPSYIEFYSEDRQQRTDTFYFDQFHSETWQGEDEFWSRQFEIP